MSDLGNKEIMARNLKKYMDINNIDRNELCSKLNIKYTTMCDWLNAKTYPRIDKIEMIANYFGISKSDLVEGKSENNYYINEDAREMAQFMFENPNYKVLFDASRKVKPEDIQIVKALLDKFSADN